MFAEVKKSDMTGKSDKELLALLGKAVGGAKAYCQIFKLYYPVLLKFASGMLKDEASAKDVVQDAFVKLWMHRTTLNPDTNIKAWLYSVVKNEILDIFRSSRVRNRAEMDQNSAVVSDQAVDRLSFLETRSLLSQAIKSMPPQRRQVFEMSHLEDMSNSDIAEKMGLSVRTVEKHLELARKYMKRFS